MPMEVNSSVEQMKFIFDLCDQDNDGLIHAQDFREIGQAHFEKPQHVEMLLQVMDPQNTGNISFLMFCHGIQTFLLEDQCLLSTDSSILSPLSSDASGSSTELKSGGKSENCEDIYPLSHHNGACLSNGYTSKPRFSAVEVVVDECEEDSSMEQLNPDTSSPGGVILSRESPTLVARNLMRRHQLTLPESPSQGSTPADEEEEVSRLSDQLHELSSRLEELEEDQKDSEGYRARLKRENTELKTRLEECEDILRSAEQANDQILTESRDKLKTSINKVQLENERHVMEMRSQLHLASMEISKTKGNEALLRTQLTLAKEEKAQREIEMEDMIEKRGLVEEELRKTKELLRHERDKWKVEKETFNQVLRERDLQIQHLQLECEEIHTDHKQNSITASDMDREINRLKKELEQSDRRNNELQSMFLQQGKELVATSDKPQSLEMEMELASKDEVMAVLKESEEMNARLKHYIDSLLTSIIEKHPEILEKRLLN